MHFPCTWTCPPCKRECACTRFGDLDVDGGRRLEHSGPVSPCFMLYRGSNRSSNPQNAKEAATQRHGHWRGHASSPLPGQLFSVRKPLDARCIACIKIAPHTARLHHRIRTSEPVRSCTHDRPRQHAQYPLQGALGRPDAKTRRVTEMTGIDFAPRAHTRERRRRTG